jgi:undecaprenyl diphosphate synthase
MLAVPTHVALIMDGNGRWAKAHGQSRSEGHRRGALSVKKVLRAAWKVGVRFVTLYAFSSENFSRPRAEVDFLMDLFEKFLRKYGQKFSEERVRFRVIGNLSELPSSLQMTISNLVKNTESFDRFNVTIALNYSSRNEIIHALKNIFSEGPPSFENFSWIDLKNYLYTRDLPDPDLIIRTSGERRLSNFLLLQAAYAELFFTQTYWPDFDEKEFLAAIEDYQRRERRMGNVDERTNV